MLIILKSTRYQILIYDLCNLTTFLGLLSSSASGGYVRVRVVLIASYALSEFRLHLDDKRYANIDENPKSSNHDQGLIILVVWFFK